MRFHLIGGFSYGLPGPGQSWAGHSWTRKIVPMGHMGHGQSVLVGHIFAWPIICLSQVVPVLSHSVWGLKLKIWSRIQSNLSSSWWYIHIFYCQNHQNVFLDQYRHLRLVGWGVQTTSNYSNFAGILFFTFRAKKSLKSYRNGICMAMLS